MSSNEQRVGAQSVDQDPGTKDAKIQELKLKMLSFVGAVDTPPPPSQMQHEDGRSDLLLPATSVMSVSSNLQVDFSEAGSSGPAVMTDQAGDAQNRRSFAAVASQPIQTTTKTALVCRAVLAAVYSELSERTRRSRNLVVTGLQPVQGTTDKDLFAQLCQSEFSVPPNFVSCRRIGSSTSNGRVRPLLVTYASATEAAIVLALGVNFDHLVANTHNKMSTLMLI